MNEDAKKLRKTEKPSDIPYSLYENYREVYLFQAFDPKRIIEDFQTDGQNQEL